MRRKKRRETERMVEKLFQEMYDNGRWFRFPKALLRFMDCEDAVTLAYLMNQSILHGDWFYCHMTHLSRELRISVRQQSRRVAKLKELGVITIKNSRVKGSKPTRLFRVNWTVVARMLIDAV